MADMPTRSGTGKSVLPIRSNVFLLSRLILFFGGGNAGRYQPRRWAGGSAYPTMADMPTRLVWWSALEQDGLADGQLADPGDRGIDARVFLIGVNHGF